MADFENLKQSTSHDDIIDTSPLKSHCHPQCFACRDSFSMYEKSAIFLIVVKSDLYLLPSLPSAI